MPYKITKSTPQRKIKAQGHIVSVPEPFAEGHSVSVAEANVLNQVFAENLRNNIATKIKAAAEAGEPLSDEQVQELFTEYATQYEFGIRSVAEPVDPVEKEARSLARTAVNAALRKQNIKVSDLEDGKHDELIDAALDKHPHFREEAERRVAATQESAADIDLDL
jgi:hypothetical protein